MKRRIRTHHVIKFNFKNKMRKGGTGVLGNMYRMNGGKKAFRIYVYVMYVLVHYVVCGATAAVDDDDVDVDFVRREIK